MAIPTVNVTGTIYDPVGQPVVGAKVKIKMSGIDLYQSQYIYPTEQIYTTDAGGAFSAALFPNAIGEMNTVYTVKAMDAAEEKTYLNTTMVVPNNNVTLDDVAGTGPVEVSKAFVGAAKAIPFIDQTERFVSFLKNFNTSIRNYIFPDTSGTVLVVAASFVLGASVGFMSMQPDGIVTRTITGTANQVIVANGDGVAGNPVLSLPQDIHSGALPTFAGLTLSTGNLTVSAGTIGLSTDVLLVRDAANFLAQRNGTSAQEFHIYNTFTDASNYERGLLGWSGNVFRVRTEHDAPGVARELALGVGGNDLWTITTVNNFVANIDNTYDIGAAGATRPRTGYFGTSVVTPLVDSGSANGLSLKVNSGETVATFERNGVTANNFRFLSGAAGTELQVVASGTDTDIAFHFKSKGAGSHIFYTGAGAAAQFQILHTASANVFITVAGSNGANATIDVSSGALRFSAGTSDILWGKPNVALGGGAAPTLGTIGGSGPAAAAQRNWLRFLESDGTASFIPVWR
jgi:hypothetical protein